MGPWRGLLLVCALALAAAGAPAAVWAKPAAAKTAAKASKTAAKATKATKAVKAAGAKKATAAGAARKVAARAQPARAARGKKADKGARVVARARGGKVRVVRVSAAPRLSMGAASGLRALNDGLPLELHSSVAYVMDQDSGMELFAKNAQAVLPIASITKLMTALVTLDADLPPDESITISAEDVDHYKGSRSRLAVGTTLSRQEMLHLALMSSENRAAHALGRTYPGGMDAFVRAMNARAAALGMTQTRYVEPTGLLSANQSSARDLATLVRAAYAYPLIRNYTTYPGADFPVNGELLRYNNTNRLVHSLDWHIGLQKTGYISEAGRCVVMQARVADRKLIIVLLDSAGRGAQRVQDAEAIRLWVQNGTPGGSGGAGSQRL